MELNKPTDYNKQHTQEFYWHPAILSWRDQSDCIVSNRRPSP